MTKPTLILVDDMEEVRKEFFVALQEDFEIVAEAASGLEAIEACKRHQPSLVIMDIVMPRMSGIEATRQILSGPAPHPKIVIVSGIKEPNIVLQAMQAGAIDYLFKPIRGEKLPSILRSLLNRN